jgi:alkylmercury lyase
MTVTSESPGARIQWAAFEELRHGRAAKPLALAATVGMTKQAVVQLLRALAANEQVELDDRGTVIGSRGLTLTPTVHRLVLAGVPLHTWCAFDSIAIPAALTADAQIDTACGDCSRSLHVDVDGGEPRAEAEWVVWLPAGNCRNLRADFCAFANLFCSSGHVDRWRARAADPTGDRLDIGAAARLGRHLWVAPSLPRVTR